MHSLYRLSENTCCHLFFIYMCLDILRKVDFLFNKNIGAPNMSFLIESKKHEVRNLFFGYLFRFKSFERFNWKLVVNL